MMKMMVHVTEWHNGSLSGTMGHILALQATCCHKQQTAVRTHLLRGEIPLLGLKETSLR